MTRLSFTTMATPEMTGIEAIRAAAAFGYDGVDLRVSQKKGELTPDATSAQIDELRRAFDAEGVQPAGLLCYNDTGSNESGSWEKMKASLLRHLEIGARLGSPTIRMFGGRIHEYPSAEDFIARTADVLYEVFDADGSGVGIVLQNHRGSYTFMQGAALARKLDHPRFGMVFSPDHCVMMGEDLDAVMRKASAVSRQLYCSDVVPTGEENGFRGILPGEGIVPLARAWRALGGNAFDGWVSFKWEKIWQDHLEGPEVALPYFVRFFEKMRT